ncbi:hypothetical protein K1B37_000993 [Vibrio parahaemolyticus]|nr:hypothetical protein [Vibrio parahaemolyticus]
MDFKQKSTFLNFGLKISMHASSTPLTVTQSHQIERKREKRRENWLYFRNCRKFLLIFVSSGFVESGLKCFCSDDMKYFFSKWTNYGNKRVSVILMVLVDLLRCFAAPSDSFELAVSNGGLLVGLELG